MPRSTAGTAIVLLAGLGAASGALAQDEAPVVLEPITVTSTKRPQDPEKVDAAVAVAGPEDLSPRDIRTVDQLDKVFPALNIRARSSRAYSNVTIRGQSSVDFYNPTVQVLVDGLPQDQTTFSQFLPLDLQQVELLYGPQGTLYGRNAIGGVLNIVTPKPDNEFHGGITGGFGNLGAFAGAWLSGPLVKDTLYGDLAIGGDSFLGEYRSLGTGERLGETDGLNGRIRLRYAPTGSPLDIMVTAARDRLDSTEEQFVPASMLNRRLAVAVPSHYELTTQSLGLTASYDLGFAKLSSITGWQDRRLNRTIFGSYTPEDQTTFSQELRLASTPEPGRAFDYVLGAYYQRLDFERRVPAAGQTSNQTIDSYALFGEATWHVTDRFDITPGVRLDYESVDAEAKGAVNLTGSQSFAAISPKLALGYQITDGLRAYALYSTGYKPGGFTRNVTPANIAFTYDPQTTHNFEAGLKSRFFDDRLLLSVAAYYNYTVDYQLFVGVQPNLYLQNAGDVESRGVDVRLQAEPIDGLRVTAAFAYNDTRFAEFANPSNPAQQLKGNRVPYAPPVTANLNLAYSLPLPGELGEVTPHVGLTYVGKTYFDETNTIGQDAYALLDAGLAWKFGEHFKAEAYVNNIADKTYTVYGFNGGPMLGELYQLGRGRETGLRLTGRF